MGPQTRLYVGSNTSLPLSVSLQYLAISSMSLEGFYLFRICNVLQILSLRQMRLYRKENTCFCNSTFCPMSVTAHNKFVSKEVSVKAHMCFNKSVTIEAPYCVLGNTSSDTCLSKHVTIFFEDLKFLSSP